MTTKELQTIKDADPEKVPFDKGIFKEMQRYIGEKTDGFKDLSGLDSKKINMEEDIKSAGKDVADFKKKYGSTSWSEQDIAQYISDVISGKERMPEETIQTPPPSTDDDEAAKAKEAKEKDKAKAKLELAKAKIKIAKAQQAQKNKNKR